MLLEIGKYAALTLEPIGWETHGALAMRCRVWIVAGFLVSHVAKLLEEIVGCIFRCDRTHVLWLFWSRNCIDEFIINFRGSYPVFELASRFSSLWLQR